MANLHRYFSVPKNSEWTFADQRSTNQFSHGYHRYPAKFSPNIVQKIIKDYSSENFTIVDLFAGCGTTLVECKLNGLNSIGVDINPITRIITNAKTHPINPNILDQKFESLEKELKKYHPTKVKNLKLPDELKRWFFAPVLLKILFLKHLIVKIENEIHRNFFLCALSNILKSSSKWLQSSTKPQFDYTKIPVDPFKLYKKQVTYMMKKNEEFYFHLKKNKFLNTKASIFIKDARQTPIEKSSADLIITSPPYVTSYEYADIHKLTTLLFYDNVNLNNFRSTFIGTKYNSKTNLETISPLADEIIKVLFLKCKSTSKQIAKYFEDMFLVSKEMNRILKTNSIACIVIGNTIIKNTYVKSSECFAEMLLANGFKLIEVIKREIPNKLLPTYRDKTTGKFTTKNNSNKKKIYSEEYIVIAKKIKDVNR